MWECAFFQVSVRPSDDLTLGDGAPDAEVAAIFRVGPLQKHGCCCAVGHCRSLLLCVDHQLDQLASKPKTL